MDTTQPQAQQLDPEILLQVQQEHISNLMQENIMLGTLVRQQKQEIESLTDLLQQKGERVSDEE